MSHAYACRNLGFGLYVSVYVDIEIQTHTPRHSLILIAIAVHGEYAELDELATEIYVCLVAV